MSNEVYEEFLESIKIRRPGNQWFKYSERHHIVPRCMGGTNDEENLIYLTYEEHYKAHQLLCEKYPGHRGLISALWRMSNGNHECTPENYAKAKKLFSDSQRGSKNPACREDVRIKIGLASSKRSMSFESRKKLSESLKGRSVSENTRESTRARSLGNKYYEGKTHTDEWKESCRNWMKGQKHVKGRIWIHKEGTSKMIDPQEFNTYESLGWFLGRGSLQKESSKELIRKSASSRLWINNGYTSTMITKDKEIPPGWVRGRLLIRDSSGRVISHE